MNYKKVLKTRNYKAGYVVKTVLVNGKQYSCDDFEMKIAYNPNGDYIGNPKDAYRLCKKRGIKPEKIGPESNACSIGFCETEQKWYGWSHRAIYGFGVGDTVKDGDIAASSGWEDEYIAEHPEMDMSLPVGFTAKTLDDCKKMAIAFSAGVS
jgi:hypothetical protein